MKKANDTGYIPFPRSDLDDLHSGALSNNQYDLYIRIRHGASPYAIARINIAALVDDFAHRKWSKNYITKLLLGLKKSGHIYYEGRAGRRGTFDVYFLHFRLPNGGGMSRFPNSNGAKDTGSQSEVSHSIDVPSQRFEDINASKQSLVERFSTPNGRGSYNDTDNENKTVRSSNLLRKDEILVNAFKPRSHEEERCREIAIAIEERAMNFLLGTLHKHGFIAIAGAWSKYQKKDVSALKNKAAYFNSLVMETVKNKSP